MGWDAIAAIGQMLGSIAVLVTLIYLALQVRHAKEEMRRSVSQRRREGAREVALTRAHDEQFCRSYAKANAGLGGPHGPFVATLVERCGLTVEEAYGLMFDQLAFWVNRVQAVSHIDEMTAPERLELNTTLRREYRDVPVSRLWYETFKSQAQSDTVRYVDNLLAHPG